MRRGTALVAVMALAVRGVEQVKVVEKVAKLAKVAAAVGVASTVAAVEGARVEAAAEGAMEDVAAVAERAVAMGLAGMAREAVEAVNLAARGVATAEAVRRVAAACAVAGAAGMAVAGVGAWTVKGVEGRTEAAHREVLERGMVVASSAVAGMVKAAAAAAAGWEGATAVAWAGVAAPAVALEGVATAVAMVQGTADSEADCHSLHNRSRARNRCTSHLCHHHRTRRLSQMRRNCSSTGSLAGWVALWAGEQSPMDVGAAADRGAAASAAEVLVGVWTGTAGNAPDHRSLRSQIRARNQRTGFRCHRRRRCHQIRRRGTDSSTGNLGCMVALTEAAMMVAHVVASTVAAREGGVRVVAAAVVSVDLAGTAAVLAATSSVPGSCSPRSRFPVGSQSIGYRIRHRRRYHPWHSLGYQCRRWCIGNWVQKEAGAVVGLWHSWRSMPQSVRFDHQSVAKRVDR